MLGAWIAFSMHFCIKRAMSNHFGQLLGGSWTEFRGLAIKCACVFALVMGGQILNYAIVSPRITIDPIWVEQITSKCGPSKLDTAFQTLSLVQSGVTGLFFGGYFGCILQAKFCKGMS